MPGQIGCMYSHPESTPQNLVSGERTLPPPESEVEKLKNQTHRGFHNERSKRGAARSDRFSVCVFLLLSLLLSSIPFVSIYLFPLCAGWRCEKFGLRALPLSRENLHAMFQYAVSILKEMFCFNLFFSSSFDFL